MEPNEPRLYRLSFNAKLTFDESLERRHWRRVQMRFERVWLLGVVAALYFLGPLGVAVVEAATGIALPAFAAARVTDLLALLASYWVVTHHVLIAVYNE